MVRPGILDLVSSDKKSLVPKRSFEPIISQNQVKTLHLLPGLFPPLRGRWFLRDWGGGHMSALSHADTQLHLSTSHTWVAPVPKTYLPPPVPSPTQEPC